MSPTDAIADARKARTVVGARWPAPLLAYLDDPPDTSQVFNWLCPCVRDLLSHLGKSTVELKNAVDLAQRQAAEGVNVDEVEQCACAFWSRRTVEGIEHTAVAQLLFALSRLDRSHGERLAGSASTPLILLEELEAKPGAIFDRVIRHFSRHVGLRNDPL